MRKTRRSTAASGIERKLTRISKKVFQLLGLRQVSVAFFLISDEEMRSLERKFLGEEKRVANILAFPEPPGFPHPDRRGRFLGEIYLNRDLYRNEFGVLSFLLIHGILHLLGYDHSRKSDMMKMEKLERRLIKGAAAV